jgi:hypothetical protein
MPLIRAVGAFAAAETLTLLSLTGTRAAAHASPTPARPVTADQPGETISAGGTLQATTSAPVWA